MADLKKTTCENNLLYIGLDSDGAEIKGFGSNSLPPNSVFEIVWSELTDSLRGLRVKIQLEGKSKAKKTVFMTAVGAFKRWVDKDSGQLQLDGIKFKSNAKSFISKA